MRVVKHKNRLLRKVVDAPSVNIQGLFGCGSEQPDLVEDVPDHCRAVATGWLLNCSIIL